MDNPKPQKTVRGARDKICSIEELGRIADDKRQLRRSVVLCHGVFDLVHMGHVRHLEAARREGDVLMVTVTADRFVNKGLGRPIFGDALRAEMLAALEYVDYVAINEAPDAEALLDVIRPDVYVKGVEYENSADDITGKIVAERAAVERHGGRLAFTDDISFSSSSLINRHLDVYDPPLRDFLDGMRANGGAARVKDLIARAAGMTVALIGEAIVDEYQYVAALGKSAKDNVVATLYQSNEIFAGGACATANHVAALCAAVDLVTCLPENCPYEPMIRQSLKSNVRLHVIRTGDRPATRKLRFVEQSASLHKLFEVYFMDDRPLPPSLRGSLAAMAADKARDADIAIVNDFGHGMIGSEVIEAVRGTAAFLAVNAQSNAANHGYNLVTKYRDADYICIDGAEARLAAGDKHGQIEHIMSDVLPRLTACRKIIVTNGPSGAYAFASDEGTSHIPALTRTAVDSVGAGDAFLAVTAPLVAAGARASDAAFIGNAAGAMMVGVVGHRQPIEKVPLLKFINTLLK